MTDKEVRRLRRIELLEIMIDQKKEIEELRARLEEARKQIERDDVLIRRFMNTGVPLQAPVSPASEASASIPVTQTAPAPRTDAPASPEAYTGFPSAAQADIPASFQPIPAADVPVSTASDTYSDEEEGDIIRMRGLSEPIGRTVTSWLTDEEAEIAPDADPQASDDDSEASSEADVPVGDASAGEASAQDPSDEADSADTADGTEPPKAKEDLDEYLRRLIKEEDA